MCVAAGLTLFEIGSIFTRNENDRMSDLDRLCVDAHENCTCQPEGSQCTTPSTPSSPVSGPLSSALANVSNSMLPAVYEGDSDDDSSPIMFQFSKPGEASPMGAVGEMSPFTPAMISLRDDDSVELSPAIQSFDGPHAEAMRPLQFMHRLGPSLGQPAAPQSTSGLHMCMPHGGQRSLARARRNAWRTKHGRGKLPAYPPLVPYTHPDQVIYVFSGLDDQQWQEFVHYIEHWVAMELHSGTWKRSTEAVSNSCPCFDGQLR
jgi:hypothetical protein